MSVDKNSLYQDLFKSMVRAFPTTPRNDLQKDCSVVWKGAKSKCRRDNAALEVEVRRLVAFHQEMARNSKSTIHAYFSKDSATEGHSAAGCSAQPVEPGAATDGHSAAGHSAAGCPAQPVEPEAATEGHSAAGCSAQPVEPEAATEGHSAAGCSAQPVQPEADGPPRKKFAADPAARGVSPQPVAADRDVEKLQPDPWQRRIEGCLRLYMATTEFRLDQLTRRVNLLTGKVDVVTAKLEGLHARVDAFVPRLPPLLPTELLLLVLERLDDESLLLGARGVCRQWRDAVRHPCVWRGRTARYGDNLRRLMISVAPCLRYCRFKRKDFRVDPFVDDLHNCAVEELSLQLLGAKERVMEKVARLLVQQALLGRLRKVTLDDLPVVGAGPVIRAVRCAGLTELSVTLAYGDEDPSSVPWPNDHPDYAPDPESASLETLNFTSYASDPVVKDLVRLHSATLRSVRLDTYLALDALQLLGSCPQLREADVPCVAAAASLRDCPLLRKLLVEVYEQVPPELVSFFMEAVELKELKIYSNEDAVHISAMELLQALGSSRQSKLEDLTIALMQDEDLLPLPSAMAGMRHLHTLRLGSEPPVEVLLGITPDSVPSLRFIELSMYGEEVCSSSQCYFLSVVDLVLRNPRLHVSNVFSDHHSEGCDKESCACCQQGAHERVRAIDMLEGVCGHPRGLRCGVIMKGCDGLSLSCYQSDRWLFL